MFISLTCWVVLGLVLGFVATKLVKLGNDDPNADLVAGVIGAVCGGWLFNAFAAGDMNSFKPWSLSLAGLVCAASLVAWHIVRYGPTHPSRPRRW
jgi:uncharacterized membrane protein YeaQ/YmgE (transglycosylase-associated protein family)